MFAANLINFKSFQLNLFLTILSWINGFDDIIKQIGNTGRESNKLDGFHYFRQTFFHFKFCSMQNQFTKSKNWHFINGISKQKWDEILKIIKSTRKCKTIIVKVLSMLLLSRD